MNRLARTLVVAVAAATTACGGSPDTGAEDAAAEAASGTNDQRVTTAGEAVGAEPLVEAAGNTIAAGSSRSSFRATQDVPGEGEIQFSGKGAVDFASRRGSLDLDISELLAASGMEMVDGTFDMIFDDDISYLHAPVLNTLFSASSTWLQYDASALPPSGSSSFGDGLRALTRFAGYDPMMPIDLLTGAMSDTVRRTGRESVDDTETTRYTARIDLERALADAPSSVQQRLIDRVGDDELDVEVDLDAGGRLRRISYVEGTGAHATSVEQEYFDFGADVGVGLPTGDDVDDFFDVVPPF